MVQKRPFVKELYEFPSKHPRQLEHNSQLVSFLEFPSVDVAQKLHTSGDAEDSFTKSITTYDKNLGIGNISGLPICTQKDVENNLPGCISNSSSTTSRTSKEDNRSKPPFHILVSPENYKSERPIRTLIHSDDIYSSILEHPPRKLVCIGPNFQADIPEWCARGAKNTSNCSDSAEASTLSPRASEPKLVDLMNDENKFAGYCVIPMLEVEPSACNGDKVGDGWTDCSCEDAGSVRCVRQHIMEARENFRSELGQERFLELGFCDMGEVVAEKWSEEDEQLFHKVVFSNPASLDKDFWDHLSVVFPFRTKQEIVSYYFNVFMLRRRAEQNRCDPMNIDSDNDEGWVSDDEDGILEEGEDSVVDSPVYQDDPCWNEAHEDDSPEYDDAAADFYKYVDFGAFKEVTNVSETHPRKLLNNCISDTTFQPSEKIFSDERDHVFQEHLCTSSGATLISQVKFDNSKCWTGSFNGPSGGGGRDFVLEPCDAKGWDVGYFTCPRNEEDFLPTCSMIEEVFGVGAWNYKARDSKGLS